MPVVDPVRGFGDHGRLRGEGAADGGIFAIGHAGYYGSMNGKRLSAPVVGIVTAS